MKKYFYPLMVLIATFIFCPMTYAQSNDSHCTLASPTDSTGIFEEISTYIIVDPEECAGDPASVAALEASGQAPNESGAGIPKDCKTYFTGVICGCYFTVRYSDTFLGNNPGFLPGFQTWISGKECNSLDAILYENSIKAQDPEAVIIKDEYRKKDPVLYTCGDKKLDPPEQCEVAADCDLRWPPPEGTQWICDEECQCVSVFYSPFEE